MCLVEMDDAHKVAATKPTRSPMNAWSSTSQTMMLAVASIDDPERLKSGGGQHTSFHDDDCHPVCENKPGGADDRTIPGRFPDTDCGRLEGRG